MENLSDFISVFRAYISPVDGHHFFMSSEAAVSKRAL